MEKTSIYKFYTLGKLLNQFTSDNAPTNIELFNRITNFIDFTNELNLKVTFIAIGQGDLQKYLQQLNIECKRKAREKASSDITNKVNLEIKKLLTTFEAEILNKNAFVFRDKEYNLEFLIHDQENLFEVKKVLSIAPFDVQYNVEESAKCLAFDRYSASAFHMLLASEGYVNFFNSTFRLCSNDETEKYYSFYDSIKETEKILKEINYNSELVGFLHILRKYYRNQTHHSNRKFTESEAMDVFRICIRVMNKLFYILERTTPEFVEQ